jgi:integrase
MRRGELLSLKWFQVQIANVNEPYIEITQAKNNKKRFIPLNEDMVSLFEQLRSNRQESDSVFLNYRNEPLKFIDNQFRNTLEKAGIEDFRFHDLRHTFASHYVMSGGDLLSLKEILGHSDLKMVERYSHLSSSYKSQMINNLSGRFSRWQKFATYLPPEKKSENLLEKNEALSWLVT